jgi:hypothetical protein
MPPYIRTPPFVHQDSLSSIASSGGKSSSTSDAESSQSSATESDSTVAGEKASDPVATVPDTPIVSNGPRKIAKIKYSLEVYDESNSESKTVTQDDVPFDFSRVYDKNGKEKDLTTGPPAIFEVITTAEGFDKRQRKLNFENAIKALDENARPPTTTPKLPPIKFEDLTVTEITETRMEIHSQKLLGAIREVVDYYPNQNLSGDVVIIHEPYWVLIHHEKELRNLLEKTSSPSKESEPVDEEKAEHLKVLLDFVQPQIDRLVPPIERRLQNKVPTVAFDSLAYLLRPGTLAYCQFDGEWIGCVIMWVKGKKERDSTKIDRWNIHVWFLAYNSEGLFRAYTMSDPDSALETKHSIPRYEGEQNVTSLKVVPKVYWDAIDNGARREQFEARGIRKFDLLRTRFQQMSHKGESLEKEKRLVRREPVVVNIFSLQC